MCTRYGRYIDGHYNIIPTFILYNYNNNNNIGLLEYNSKKIIETLIIRYGPLVLL